MLQLVMLFECLGINIEENDECSDLLLVFFFNDTATTEIYTLSLHDALPISMPKKRGMITLRAKSTIMTMIMRKVKPTRKAKSMTTVRVKLTLRVKNMTTRKARNMTTLRVKPTIMPKARNMTMPKTPTVMPTVNLIRTSGSIPNGRSSRWRISAMG